jgi:hypothetical protein
MPKAASKSLSSSDKPSKPYREFPLFAHDSGQWAKKIRGKTVYFGVWTDPDAARDKYLEHKDELPTGLPLVNGKVTVKQMVNQFLRCKKALVDSGELSQRTLDDYHVTCDRVLMAFGKSRPVESLRPRDLRTVGFLDHRPSASRRRLAD